MSFLSANESQVHMRQPGQRPFLADPSANQRLGFPFVPEFSLFLILHPFAADIPQLLSFHDFFAADRFLNLLSAQFILTRVVKGFFFRSDQ